MSKLSADAPTFNPGKTAECIDASEILRRNRTPEPGLGPEPEPEPEPEKFVTRDSLELYRTKQRAKFLENKTKSFRKKLVKIEDMYDAEKKKSSELQQELEKTKQKYEDLRSQSTKTIEDLDKEINNKESTINHTRSHLYARMRDLHFLYKGLASFEFLNSREYWQQWDVKDFPFVKDCLWGGSREVVKGVIEEIHAIQQSGILSLGRLAKEEEEHRHTREILQTWTEGTKVFVKSALKYQFLFKEIQKIGIQQSDWIIDCMEDIEVPETSDIEDITFRRWARNLQEEAVPTRQTQNIDWVDEEAENQRLQEWSEEASFHALISDGDVDAKINASILIQKVFRGFIFRKNDIRRFLKYSEQIAFIQRVWRGYSSRGIRFTKISWNEGHRCFALDTDSFNTIKVRSGQCPAGTNPRALRRVGIRFLNTSDKEIRIYWLKNRRNVEPRPQEARDYQVKSSGRIKPLDSLACQSVTSHQFVIQYGMDTNVPDHVARAAFVDRHSFFARSEGCKDVSYKYIRIPPNIKSGSAFDLTSGITIDPDTWTSRAENFTNPVLRAPYVNWPTQEFIDTSNKWKNWQEVLKCDGVLRNQIYPASWSVRPSGSLVMRWDQMAVEGSAGRWCCRTCLMPNDQQRQFCWACRQEKELQEENRRREERDREDLRAELAAFGGDDY